MREQEARDLRDSVFPECQLEEDDGDYYLVGLLTVKGVHIELYIYSETKASICAYIEGAKSYDSFKRIAGKDEVAKAYREFFA